MFKLAECLSKMIELSIYVSVFVSDQSFCEKFYPHTHYYD